MSEQPSDSFLAMLRDTFNLPWPLPEGDLDQDKYSAGLRLRSDEEALLEILLALKSFRYTPEERSATVNVRHLDVSVGEVVLADKSGLLKIDVRLDFAEGSTGCAQVHYLKGNELVEVIGTIMENIAIVRYESLRAAGSEPREGSLRSSTRSAEGTGTTVYEVQRYQNKRWVTLDMGLANSEAEAKDLIHQVLVDFAETQGSHQAGAVAVHEYLVDDPTYH